MFFSKKIKIYEKNNNKVALSDRVSSIVGSWGFIITLTLITLFWIIWNTNSHNNKKFDPYPFILLNLSYSFLAGYTAPILLMAANRQSEIDRKRAIENLELDRMDHKIIIALEEHIDKHFDGINEKLDKMKKL
jgi:uncharacterized membrane protein